MSAEKLREAALVLRSHAEASSRGPWTAKRAPGFHHGDETLYAAKGGGYIVRPAGTHGGMFNDRTDLLYVLAVQPAVGLALASWLREEASRSEERDVYFFPIPALVIADLILGDDA